MLAATALLAAAQAAPLAGPPAVALEGHLEAIDAGCILGTDRRGRSVDMCLYLTPHVQSMACHEAADLGGYVCDYVVDYVDDIHHLVINDTVEARSELFARDPEVPVGWRFVREVAPMRMQPRPRRRH